MLLMLPTPKLNPTPLNPKTQTLCFITILFEVGSGRSMRMAPSRRSRCSQVLPSCSQWHVVGQVVEVTGQSPASEPALTLRIPLK